MGKLRIVQNSFTGGEISPRLYGRSDHAKWASSVKRMRNALPTIYGSVTRRPGTRFVLNAKRPESNALRLIPFTGPDGAGYVLHFYEGYMQPISSDGTLLGSPLVSPYLANDAALKKMKYTQDGDNLLITHPDHQPKRVRRVTNTVWEMADIGYTNPPLSETGHRPATGLTLSASTGTVTITAGASCFVQGDVGREITADSVGGKMTIASYISATQCTATVSLSFTSTTLASGAWTIEGTPLADINVESTGQTSAGRSPAATLTLGVPAAGQLVATTSVSGILTSLDVGRLITNTLDGGTAQIIQIVNNTSARCASITAFGAASYTSGQWSVSAKTIGLKPPFSAGVVLRLIGNTPCFRDFASVSDVGRRLTIGGGIVRITSAVSTSEVYATVEKTVSDLTIVSAETSGEDMFAFAGNWQIKTHAFGADGLSNETPPAACCIHGGRLWFGRGSTVWGSAVREGGNFALGLNPNDAVELTVGADRWNSILHLMSRQTLAVMTASSEFIIHGQNGGAIAPTTANVASQSQFGSDDARPARVGQSLMYVQRGGRRVRLQSYNFQSDSFNSEDATLFAEHIGRLGIKQMAYHGDPYHMAVAVLDDGRLATCSMLQDEAVKAWALHDSPNATFLDVVTFQHYGEDKTWLAVRREQQQGAGEVEFIEELDSAALMDCQDPDATLLEGFVFDLLGDGAPTGLQVTIGTGGAYTVPPQFSTHALGFNFTSSITLLQPEMMLNDGPLVGRTTGIGTATLRVQDTAMLRVNGMQLPIRQMGAHVLGQPVEPYSGDIQIQLTGNKLGGPDVTIEQTEPAAFEVSLICREVQIT